MSLGHFARSSKTMTINCPLWNHVLHNFEPVSGNEASFPILQNVRVWALARDVQSFCSFGLQFPTFFKRELFLNLRSEGRNTRNATFRQDCGSCK